MEHHKQPRWGPQFTTPLGYVTRLGRDAFRHVFGGDSWKIHEPEPVAGGGKLLLTLDLSDPRLSEIRANGLTELPICSYLDGNVFEHPQDYQLFPAERRIEVLGRRTQGIESLEEELRIEVIRPKRLRLIKMTSVEYPNDELNYWNACDILLGSRSFIRILGPPVWLQWVETHQCPRCQGNMQYVCGIGYELFDHPEGYLEDRAFFIGESALYFFLCGSCLVERVVSQST